MLGEGRGYCPHFMGEETEAREGGDKREHPRKNQVPGAPPHHHSGPGALTVLSGRSSATSASDPRSAGSGRSARCLRENRLGEQGLGQDHPLGPRPALPTSSPPAPHLLPNPDTSSCGEGGEQRREEVRQREEALLFQACHLPDLTGRVCQHPHLTDEETEAQRDGQTRSHS